ncbi:hypothetical protein [Aestuariimicrobium kwangyangense]|uniref:hypothetical protein n=1 Tax=Aestuariimicrobium kwangyangense TaxID=396389 RepID=UPI00058E2A57|nr:hypothetical protein [Aestuariimicrobium kwangyangense]
MAGPCDVTDGGTVLHARIVARAERFDVELHACDKPTGERTDVGVYAWPDIDTPMTATEARALAAAPIEAADLLEGSGHEHQRSGQHGPDGRPSFTQERDGERAAGQAPVLGRGQAGGPRDGGDGGSLLRHGRGALARRIGSQARCSALFPPDFFPP